jgi:hypothetical protein
MAAALLLLAGGIILAARLISQAIQDARWVEHPLIVITTIQSADMGFEKFANALDAGVSNETPEGALPVSAAIDTTGRFVPGCAD